MEQHRTRMAKSIDGNGDHLFVEYKQDKWIELTHKGTHKELHKLVDGKMFVCYDTRAFDIGIVKDWKESTLIC